MDYPTLLELSLLEDYILLERSLIDSTMLDLALYIYWDVILISLCRSLSPNPATSTLQRLDGVSEDSLSVSIRDCDLLFLSTSTLQRLEALSKSFIGLIPTTNCSSSIWLNLTLFYFDTFYLSRFVVFDLPKQGVSFVLVD